MCDGSRGGLSEQALFNMSNASSERAGTIVLGGGLERCQNLPHEHITMVTGTCSAWQAGISRTLQSWAYIYTYLLLMGDTLKPRGAVGH